MVITGNNIIDILSVMINNIEKKFQCCDIDYCQHNW